MTDRSQGPAYLWRPEIVGTVDAVYEEYGEEHGWPGIPPYEIVEAYIAHESEGVPGAVNPVAMPNGEHATGLMQIVPGYSVTGAWTDYSGESVTQEQLKDPATNLRVGIVGLGDRALDVQRTGWFGYDENGQPGDTQSGPVGPDWPTTVTISMWGAGYMDGYGFWQPDWGTRDDPSGEDAPGMRKFLADYVAGFGPDVSKPINRGEWRAGDDPDRKKFVPYNNSYSVFPWVEGTYEGVKGAIGDAVESKIAGELAQAIEGTIPRFAMIAAGIAMLAGALVLIKTMAISGAVGA